MTRILLALWTLAALVLVYGCGDDGIGEDLSSLYGPCSDGSIQCQDGLVCMPDPSKAQGTFLCSQECTHVEVACGGLEPESGAGDCVSGVPECAGGCCHINNVELSSGDKDDPQPCDISHTDEGCPDGHQLFYGKCAFSQKIGTMTGYCIPFVQ